MKKTCLWAIGSICPEGLLINRCTKAAGALSPEPDQIDTTQLFTEEFKAVYRLIKKGAPGKSLKEYGAIAEKRNE